MKIIKSELAIKYNGVANLENIKNIVVEKSEQFKNIVVTEDSLKGCKEVLEEIKPLRTEIKKFRAELNKELTSKLKDKLSEVDEITSIINDVIEPIEKGIEFFEEEKRLKKIEAKKIKYMPAIENINSELKEINLPYFYNLQLIEWKDEFANKSDAALQKELLEIRQNIINDVIAKTERVDLIKTNCKLLQQEWSLETEINWQYLRSDIYSDNWKEKLEDLAAHQQTQELQIKEKERLKTEREEEAKRKEIERKHLQELQAKEKEIESIKEQVAEVKQIEMPTSSNNKEFKLRIDCVLSAESFEEIEKYIKSVLITDRIMIKQI